MANEDINLDRDWSATLNVSGINAPAGGNKNLELPEGYYKAAVSDMYINHERNSNRVIIKLTVTEGPFAGVVRTTGLGLPKDDRDNVRYYWRGLSESVGYTPAQLDAGSINIDRTTYVDREAHIHFVPKSETENGYEKIDFLAPAEWSQQNQMFMAREKIEGEKKMTEAPSVAPSSLSGNTTTKADVLSKLGL